MPVSIRPALGPVFIVLRVLVVGVAGLIIGYWVDLSFFSDRTPAQPLEFSHKIHAGDNGVPCQYCHIYARRSTAAGVPSVNKCVNCHKQMIREEPEIVKLFEYWESKEPIPWVKVHDLPDFVYFPHKRHILAELDCVECHGNVTAMTRITRVSSLQMGWCRDCHQKNEVEHGQMCSTCHK